MPAEAKKQTPEGLMAFGAYFVELMNYTQATNDTKPIARWSSPKCLTCEERLIDPYKQYEADGIWIVGGDINARMESATSAGPDSLVMFKATIEEGRMYSSADPESDVLEGSENLRGILTAEWDERWLITSIGGES